MDAPDQSLAQYEQLMARPQSPEVKQREVKAQTTTNNAQEKTEIYNLASPYNLYIRLSDLNDVYVYFIAYAAGSLRNVLWGYYDQLRDEFVFEGECKYQSLRDLINILDAIDSYGYIYISNIVRDLISLTMADISPDTKEVSNRFDVAPAVKVNTEQRLRLQLIGDGFLRVMESQSYATKSVETPCLNPSECIRNSMLNPLQNNLSNETFNRCMLYFSGDVPYRRSEEYMITDLERLEIELLKRQEERDRLTSEKLERARQAQYEAQRPQYQPPVLVAVTPTIPIEEPINYNPDLQGDDGDNMQLR